MKIILEAILTRMKSNIDKGNFLDAKFAYLECLEVLKRQDIPVMEFIIQRIISLCFAMKQLDDVFLLLSWRLENQLQSGNRADIAGTYIDLGSTLMEQGKLDAAMTNFQKALEIAEEFDQIVNVATILDNIGLIQMYKGQLDKAKQSYKKSLKFRKHLHDKAGIASTL